MSHNKSLIYNTDLSFRPSELGMTQEKFLQSIDQHGRDIEVERAMKCPCVNRATGQALLSCSNCGGVGWIWINRRQSRAFLQMMNRETKFKQWTVEDSGRIGVTFRPNEDIAFMDRIMDIELESTYSQNVDLVNIGADLAPVWAGRTIYYPLEVVNAFLFISDSVALQPLVLDTDYSITDNTIQLLDNSILTPLNDPTRPTISIRFHHNPTYHILDITRERVSTRERDCESGYKQLKRLPTHAICLRAHELLNQPDVNGNALLDNTNIGENQDF